jgi:hypothetical protein
MTKDREFELQLRIVYTPVRAAYAVSRFRKEPMVRPSPVV